MSTTVKLGTARLSAMALPDDFPPMTDIAALVTAMNELTAEADEPSRPKTIARLDPDAVMKRFKAGERSHTMAGRAEARVAADAQAAEVVEGRPTGRTPRLDTVPPVSTAPTIASIDPVATMAAFKKREAEHAARRGGRK